MDKSPVPQIRNNESNNPMNFSQAVNILVDGKKITRLEWNDESTYIVLKDERLKIVKPSGKVHDLIISAGDMYGTDWVIVHHS